MAKTIRVYKDGNVWVAKKDGFKVAAVKNTQREAYLAARKIALNQGLTITVYYPTGGIKAVINPRDSNEESDCFITTSCIKYFGLKDDCYELQTLREFRDNHLIQGTVGKKLVLQYYLLAPEIVKQLQKHKDRKRLYIKAYAQIKKACQAIESKQFSKAILIYKKAVLHLANHLKMK